MQKISVFYRVLSCKSSKMSDNKQYCIEHKFPRITHKLKRRFEGFEEFEGFEGFEEA